MLNVQQSRPLVRDAPASFWRSTLSQIPTLFGRLVYLASIRDQNTGEYEHPGLAQIYGLDQADHAIRGSHEHTFADWLNLSLEHQKRDLLFYLSTLESDLPRILSSWARLEPYRNLVPIDAREADRQLFLSDLEINLELLRNQCGLLPV
jgi:hypothetical protein